MCAILFIAVENPITRLHRNHYLHYIPTQARPTTNTELGIEGVGFVMDKGFCSTDNVKYMKGNGLDFVMGAEIGHKATRDAVPWTRCAKVWSP